MHSHRYWPHSMECSAEVGNQLFEGLREIILGCYLDDILFLKYISVALLHLKKESEDP